MKRLLALIPALLLALALAAPAQAHRQKITISTIAHNARTGMVEVVHRVPLHDAEHALKAQGVRAPDIINDLPSRRAFARYLAERFTVTAGGEAIAFTLLGSEIEGGNLIVLQEAPSPGSGAAITVLAQILTDYWPQQENRVNLGSGTNVKTLIFEPGDRSKLAVLP